MNAVYGFLFFSLVLPIATLAAEPVIVQNSDKPLWDSTHRIDFKENLRIGDDEDDDKMFGQRISIAADSKGRIIVADYNQNLVRRFNATGEFLGAIGRGGEGPGEYRNIMVIATDAKDKIYVGGQGRISIFDGNGVFIREFMDDSHGVARSIRSLSDGSVVISEYDYPTDTALQKYVDGKHTAHFCDVFKLSQEDKMALMGYLGGCVDVGSDGMIYFTQISPYEIRKFTPAGDLVTRIQRENDFVSFPKVEKIDNGTRISGGCGSFGIFVLPDGKFVNVILGAKMTILDLFDRDGRLLLSQRLEKPFHPQWVDVAGNAYWFDHDALEVVRARMTIH